VNGKFYRGILTGLNEAFVIDRHTRDRLIKDDPNCAELFKRFLRGKNVKRWKVEFNDEYLIKIESSVNKKHPWSEMPGAEAEKIFSRTYPSIYRHFQRFRDRLMKRDDQGKYFWELRSCKYWDAFDKYKIVWGNLSKYPKFSFANTSFYLNAPAVLMESDSGYLLGILNSTITQYLVSQSAASRQGGFLEFKPMYISKLAIPKQPKYEKISKSVDEITKTLSRNSSTKIRLLETEIDARVAHLYKLTEEEYALVLKETNCPDPFRVAALNVYRDIVRGKIK